MTTIPFHAKHLPETLDWAFNDVCFYLNKQQKNFPFSPTSRTPWDGLTHPS